MKALKLYPSIVLLLAVISYKKKDEVAPDTAKTDLTKYFITMEFVTEFTGGSIDGKLTVIRMKNGGTNAESFMYGTLTRGQ